MTSVVVMAGYQNKREVKRYSKIVAEHYGENFVETGYKPLREFNAMENGKLVSKPVIQFTLEKLLNNPDVDDIVIVGHQMLLEQRLGDFIAKAEKQCQIINQNTRLSEALLVRYNILKRKVKFNSITGNMIKGYDASKAADKKAHALFVASDSPLTTEIFMNRFVALSNEYIGMTAVVVPAIIIKDAEDQLGRKPLRLVNDTKYQLPGYTDPQGRQGFRLSSVLLANPNQFDINTVNMAYSLRKFLSPKIQIRLFKITRKLGFSNVYSKYFIKKDLSISDCEKITSQFFRGRLTLIPMEGEAATYDYDGTDKEYTMINEMLTHTH